MKFSVLPPPASADLLRSRVHELIRDYPELLGPLESMGIDAGEAGGTVIGSLLPTGDRSLPGLVALLRWREGKA